MNPELSRKIIGGGAAFGGLWWLWIVTFPLVSKLWKDDTAQLNGLFVFTVIPLMMTPGLFLVIHGVRLFRRLKESSVRWIVGVGIVFLSFSVTTQLSRLFPALLPERLLNQTLFFASNLALVPVFCFVLRFLLRHLQYGAPPMAPLLSRTTVGLLAWQLWFLLSAYWHVYEPKAEGYTGGAPFLWLQVGLFGPILVAYGLYWMVCSLMTGRQNKPVMY